MSYVTWQVERTPWNGTSYSGSTVTIDKIYSPVIIKNLNDGRNSFEFKLTNFNNEVSNYFSTNDKITISRALNTTTIGSTNLLMNGVIKQLPDTISSTKNEIKVEGYDYSDLVLSALTFVDARTLKINEMLEQAFSWVKANTGNFNITWVIPATKTDGSPFPVVGEKFYYKTMKDILRKYSTLTKTEDVDYYYFVDKDNVFRWLPRTNATVDTFNSSTNSHLSLKTDKDTNNVRNHFIMQGGFDPYGKQIQLPVTNQTSINKYGRRWQVVTETNTITRFLIDQDLNKAGVREMKDATFPYTTAWSTPLTTAGTEYTIVSGKMVATSMNGYVNAVRDHVKDYLKRAGELYKRKYGEGTLKFDVVFSPGTKTWDIGNIISCTIPSLGTKAKTLRVTEIQYTTESDTFTLVEDVGKVTT
jgi:hypothetical protein